MSLAPDSPIYIFGEVVFDCFDQNKRTLGGAPFNVAWNLQHFGLPAELISAVGKDELGKDVIESMLAHRLSTRSIQINNEVPTGRVNVSHSNNEPEYDIIAPAAFDRIDQNLLPSIDSDSLLYYGTLAARDDISRRSLAKLISSKAQRFVDVNLRSPWWSLESTLELIQFADYVKLNGDELQMLSPPHLKAQSSQNNFSSVIELAKAFKLEFGIVNLFITLGENGAVFIDPTGNEHFSPVNLNTPNIVDTVGAGDAFASVIIIGILYEWDWQTALSRAQEFASLIVSQQGAICKERTIYQDFISLWGINH